MQPIALLFITLVADKWIQLPIQRKRQVNTNYISLNGQLIFYVIALLRLILGDSTVMVIISMRMGKSMKGIHPTKFCQKDADRKHSRCHISWIYGCYKWSIPGLPSTLIIFNDGQYYRKLFLYHKQTRPLVLDVKGANSALGARVIIFLQNTPASANQLWTFDWCDSSYETLRNQVEMICTELHTPMAISILKFPYFFHQS